MGNHTTTPPTTAALKSVALPSHLPSAFLFYFIFLALGQEERGCGGEKIKTPPLINQHDLEKASHSQLDPRHSKRKKCNMREKKVRKKEKKGLIREFFPLIRALSLSLPPLFSLLGLVEINTSLRQEKKRRQTSMHYKYKFPA